MRVLHLIAALCALVLAGAAVAEAAVTDPPPETDEAAGLSLADVEAMLGAAPTLEDIQEAERALRAGRVVREDVLDALQAVEGAYRSFLTAEDADAQAWAEYADYLHSAMPYISDEADRLETLPADPLLDDAAVPADFPSAEHETPLRLLYAWSTVGALEPENPWPHNELGHFYCEEFGLLGYLDDGSPSESYERGLRHFHRAVRKGRALLELGVTEELRQDVATYLHNLALFSEQHPTEAREVYAVAHDGRKPSPLDLYKWVLELFEEGVGINPEDAELAWNYAATVYDKIYYRLRNTAEMRTREGRPRTVLNRELASLVDWQTAIDMAKRYIELRSGPETGADDRVKQAYQLWLVFYAQHCAADDRFTQKDRDKLRDIMAQQDGYIARVTPGEYEVSDSRRQFRQDLIAAVEEQAGGPGR